MKSLLALARTSLDGNGPCAECGMSDNIVWFTDNSLWNNVIRWDGSGTFDDADCTYALKRWGHDPILCIRCFVSVVEERGYRPVSWRVVPEWPWVQEQQP